MEVLQVQSELDYMIGLYRERQPARVLEIGVWDGGTLREWLTQGHPEIVVAVDLDHRNKDAYPEWVSGRTDLQVIAGNSQHPGVIAAFQKHAPYDWVFIDGDHSDAGVGSDVEHALPLVREGGVLVLHDIDGGDSWEDDYPPRTVLRRLAGEGFAVSEFVDSGACPDAHGVGVVQL